MAQNSCSCLLLMFVFTNNILMQVAEQHNDYYFDILPGSPLEFKFEVQPGRQECFYQKLKQDAELQVLYQVLRGGDRTIDIFVKDSSNKLIIENLSKNQGALKMRFKKADTYEICVDNTRARLVSKLVFLRIYVLHAVHMRVINPYEWTKMFLHEAIHNLTKLTEQMSEYQVRSRLSLMSDWYLTKGNNVYVMYYSFAQCLVIVLTSCAQVYVLRRFFRTVPVTNSVKSRA